MGCERVDLSAIEGLRGCRRWMCGQDVVVTVGQMPEPDGRHFAHHSRRGRAFVYAVERDACSKADLWLADGREWEPRPAAFSDSGEPIDGRR